MLVRIRLIFILILCFWAKCTSSGKCPAVYLRFSAAHTFCLKPNPKCDIKKSGVSKKDANLIVEYHNAFRNITAMGKEKRARGGALPQAADMLQMVWDGELAAIAQKWTDNCDYNHDCGDGCRTVRNFAVGQNLARFSATCVKESCEGDEDRVIREPDWENTLRGLYDEVVNYQKKWFYSYEKRGKVVGHFTQIVWSKSWRVGCGYTSYKDNKMYHRFYACNYGPAGNTKGKSLYKVGKPCSACPENTCCGKSCGKNMDYPGLCKLLDPETAPVYSKESVETLFFCDSIPKTKDCSAKVSGTKRWKQVNSLSGHFMSIELKGGEETALRFHNEIKPSASSFCVETIYRKSPSKAGEKDASTANVVITTASKTSNKALQISSLSFSSHKITLNWENPTKIAISFSVPSGGNPHIFEVKEILAYNGHCKL